MQYRATFVVAIVGLVVISVSTQGGSQSTLGAKPGLWEIHTTAGGLRVPITKCVTANDFTDPQRVADAFGHPANPMLSRMPDPGWGTLAQQVRQKCTYTNLKQDAASIEFKYECEGGFHSTEDGTIKFESPTKYTATFSFQGDDQMNVRPGVDQIDTKGERVDDCTKSTAGGSSNPFSRQ